MAHRGQVQATVTAALVRKLLRHCSPPCPLLSSGNFQHLCLRCKRQSLVPCLVVPKLQAVACPDRDLGWLLIGLCAGADPERLAEVKEALMSFLEPNQTLGAEAEGMPARLLCQLTRNYPGLEYLLLFLPCC